MIGGTPLSFGAYQVASGDAERLSGESTLKTARPAGTLLRAFGSKFGDRVFFCARGRRHWVMDVRWITENGFSWPKDVIEVPPEVLESLMPGRAAAPAWDEVAWLSPPRSSVHEMRELCVSRLQGRGYEIGPGPSPMPIPLHCDVKYIDAVDCATLKKLAYSGQDTVELIEPDIVTEFEDLSEIPEQSADFFVGAHVIEHTRDPIGCMVQAYRRLRRGGYLVLVVPDMTRTFDRDRALTSLDHLIEDQEHPDHERDSVHFKEFHTKAFPIAPEEFEAAWRTQWEERARIHYHTWTYESFGAMVDYISGHLCRFDEVWSQPTLDVEGANEFYFALRK